jgi:hypothetical protein
MNQLLMLCIAFFVGFVFRCIVTMVSNRFEGISNQGSDDNSETIGDKFLRDDWLNTYSCDELTKYAKQAGHRSFDELNEKDIREIEQNIGENIGDEDYGNFVVSCSKDKEKEKEKCKVMPMERVDLRFLVCRK